MQKAKFTSRKILQFRFIHLNDLLKAKETGGRFKDKNDIEQLKKKNKPD